MRLGGAKGDFGGRPSLRLGSAEEQWSYLLAARLY